MKRWLETGGRAYPLRFTAAALVRAQEVSGYPFRQLFRSGAAGLCALLYAALCDGEPRLTLQGAAELAAQAVAEGTPPEELAELLTKALADSGFDVSGASRAEVERLLSAAARAGYPAPEELAGMTLREIDRALQRFCAGRALPAGRVPAMTDEAMQAALRRLDGKEEA